MNFRRRRVEEPEINLIPFIDVLLVVLIFLMLSTTFSQLTQIQITLPTANTGTPRYSRAMAAAPQVRRGSGRRCPITVCKGARRIQRVNGFMVGAF